MPGLRDLGYKEKCAWPQKLFYALERHSSKKTYRNNIHVMRERYETCTGYKENLLETLPPTRIDGRFQRDMAGKLLFEKLSHKKERYAGWSLDREHWGRCSTHEKKDRVGRGSHIWTITRSLSQLDGWKAGPVIEGECEAVGKVSSSQVFHGTIIMMAM